MRRSAPAPVVTGLVAAWLALAGCGGDVTAPAVPSVEAALAQHRRDAGTRTLQVTVTNTGAAPFVVDRVRLDAPDFAPQPDASPGTTIAPGQRVDLPVPYGEAACAGDVPARAQLAHAVLTLHREEAPPTTVRLPLRDDGSGSLLGRLLAGDCERAALRRVVDVRLDGPWTQTGGELHGSLVLERVGGSEPVKAVQVAGSVLFALEPGPAPGAALPALASGEPVAAGPVAVRPARCDGHARGESKRPYDLLVWVQVADRSPLPVEVRPDEADRAAFDRLWAGVCT